MNIFQPHVSVSELADYFEGNLSLLRRMELELHVAACSRCAADLAELERLIGLMSTARPQDASSVIDRAVRLFQSRAGNTASGSDLPSRVLAVLPFDSLGLAPAFGVRSGKPGARQLLFRAGIDQIDLRIEPADRVWTVSGQILGEPATGGRAVLQGATSTSETAITEPGEFVLPPLEAGTYKLILSLANIDVEIEEIRIGL